MSSALRLDINRLLETGVEITFDYSDWRKFSQWDITGSVWFQQLFQGKRKSRSESTGDGKFETLPKNQGENWLCQNSKGLSLLGAAKSMKERLVETGWEFLPSLTSLYGQWLGWGMVPRFNSEKVGPLLKYKTHTHKLFC